MMKVRQNASTDSELFGYFVGHFTENIARLRLSAGVPITHLLMDGHEPFYAPNLIASDGRKPKNLDIVEIELSTGNAIAIYEVKAAMGLEKEFRINGQCGQFMKLAAERNIPTYLTVVRLDRAIRLDILKEDSKTKEAHVDEEVYASELDHFIKHAKIEVYDSKQFSMSSDMFVVSDKFVYP